MCNVAVLEFFIENVKSEEFKGKKILEVGSRYVNGSVRPLIERFLHPGSYVGIDVQPGKYVELVLPAEKMLEYFGSNAFDVIISTEVLEHVWNWKKIILSMKSLVKPRGFVYITTRSIGFPLHGYPYDFWRFEANDMKSIFSDCEVLAIKQDPLAPGVFVKVRKPHAFAERDLSDYELFSMVVDRRVNEISAKDIRKLHYKSFLKRIVKEKVLHIASRVFGAS